MIKVVIQEANEYIDIDKQTSCLIVLENKNYFYKALTNLENDYLDDSLLKVVDENYKRIKLIDYGDVILNLFSIDVNNKRNLNVVFKQIKLLFKEELSYGLTSIKEILNDCFGKIKIDYNLDLINDIDLVEDDLIKILNLKIKDESKSLLEKLMIYIRTAIELRKTKFFIFISLSMYLEEDEINLLLKNCQLFDVSIIDIESQKLDFENFDKKIIIDKDICLLK